MYIINRTEPHGSTDFLLLPVRSSLVTRAVGGAAQWLSGCRDIKSYPCDAQVIPGKEVGGYLAKWTK